MSVLSLLFVAWGLIGVSFSFDYCNPSLCLRGFHVACGVKVYGSICSYDAHVLPITADLKDTILLQINGLRNMLAGGGYKGFLPANRMATVSWEPELAFLAEYNVMRCELVHDKCRNSLKYGNVGQTVSYSGYRNHTHRLSDIIIGRIDAWFGEHDASSMDDIFNYIKPTHGHHTLNFLQLALAQNDRVGCAILQQTENEWLQTYFTCNYARAPVWGQHVYESSDESASKCKTGVDRLHINLCSVNENYNDGRSSLTRKSENNNSSLARAATEVPVPAPVPIWGNDLPPPFDVKKKKELLDNTFGRFLRLVFQSHAKRNKNNIIIITNNHDLDDDSQKPLKIKKLPRPKARTVRRPVKGIRI